MTEYIPATLRALFDDIRRALGNYVASGLIPRLEAHAAAWEAERAVFAQEHADHSDTQEQVVALEAKVAELRGKVKLAQDALIGFHLVADATDGDWTLPPAGKEEA